MYQLLNSSIYNFKVKRQRELVKMGDLPYVEWLARKYMEKGEISRCWSDYLKVNLYQLMLVLRTGKVKL